MMDDNSVTTTTTTTSNSIEGNSLSIASVNTATSSTSNHGFDKDENFETWKKDGKTRYLLPHLLCKKRVEEQLDIEKHCSDAAVWNAVYMTSNESFPESSPNWDLKCDVLYFLRRFKKYVNKVVLSEVKMKYCNIANQEQWKKLRPDGESFSSFENMVKRTKYSVGKEV